MNLPLMHACETSGIRLQSLGGAAPFEYCDGAHGLQDDSKFTLNAQLVR
jgi:hypothetical protein